MAISKRARSQPSGSPSVTRLLCYRTDLTLHIGDGRPHIGCEQTASRESTLHEPALLRELAARKEPPFPQPIEFTELGATAWYNGLRSIAALVAQGSKTLRVRQRQTMVLKQPCSACGALILPSTSDKTGGLCMPCFTGRREQMNQAARFRESAEPLEFAPNDEVESLRPFVDEFWATILETSYATSFVSNNSTLDAWEHYAGGRAELIERVHRVYGVDITSYYDKPIPTILRKVRDGAA